MESPEKTTNRRSVLGAGVLGAAALLFGRDVKNAAAAKPLAAPAPNHGWATPVNYTATRALDQDQYTVNELADVLATLIADLEADGTIR